MRQPGCRAPNQLARLALPSSPCPAWPRREEGAPHCEQEEALRSRSPSPSSTAERRTKRRQNQAREGCVAQASCAETVCPPAAKAEAAQSEGRTVLSKPSARLVERARRERRAGLCGGTVPSATSVRAGGSLSPSVSHTVVAWRCLEDRTLTGAPHRVRGRTLARGGRTAFSGGLPRLVLTLDAVRPVHHHEGPVVGRAAPFWLALTARRRSGTHARAASKRLSMRRLATLSHTRRGGVSGAQLLALQGHNHTSERVD